MKNYVIIEDEDDGVKLIQNFMRMEYPDMQCLGTARSVNKAIQLINESKPELIFLDISIVGGNGFEILDKLTHKDVVVIFITGYNNHAVRAIKLSAYDYLVKPLDLEEFRRTMIRLTSEGLSQKRISDFSENSITHLEVFSNGKKTFLDISQILYLESNRRNTLIYLPSGQYSSGYHLGYFEEQLGQKYFVRCHRTIIVNMTKVVEFNSDEMKLYLGNNVYVPVAQRKRAAILEALYTKFQK